jgi:predicted phage-related endonuclease
MTIRPASRDAWLADRYKTVGGSESPALLGIHPYLTAYELFMRKTGVLQSEKSAPIVCENSIHLPPLERGNFYEEKGIELARMLRPEWEIISNPIPGGVVNIDTEAGMSSTPDATIILPGREKGVLQVKNVESFVFERKWKESGEITPPLWISVQVLQDCILAGASRAFIGVLVNSFNVDFYLIEVPMHEGVIKRLREEVMAFWDRVARNDPPSPDYNRDGAILAQIYSRPSGDTIDLSGNNRIRDLINEYASASDTFKKSDLAKKALRAEIIEMMAGHGAAIIDGNVVVTAKAVHRDEYVVKASDFVDVRFKKV